MKVFRFICLVFIFTLLQSCNKESTKDNNNIPQSLAEKVSQLQLEKNIPAIAFATVNNSQIQVAVAGTLAINSNQKLIESDPVPLASDSKALTASLIARLVEQGKLHWSDTLIQWLPEFESSMDASYENLTIEQLLRHESGLLPLTDPKEVADAIDAIGGLTGDVNVDQRKMLSFALATPARFSPGSKTEYGNTNYVLAGRIAEIAGKDTYENLIHREIFIPLGIKGQNTIPKTGVLGHTWENGQWKVKVFTTEDDYLNNQLALAAGGWYMTMSDYAQFLKANIDGLRGQSTWLKESTLKYMHSISRVDEFGIGWKIITNNGETFSQHLGSDEESYLHGVIFSQKTGKGVAFFTSGYSTTTVDAVSDFAVYLWQQ